MPRLQDILVGVPIFLVGGAVRDVYRRWVPHDLDLVVAGDGRTWARKIANKLGGAYYALDDERQVGRAIIVWDGENYVIDVSAQRGGTLLDDLTARDFTVNAIAASLTGDMQTLIDPLDGIGDLNQKRLRRCSPASISDDPVRVLRAIRQSVAFGFAIDRDTRQDLRHEGVRIPQLSVERVRDEFMTMLDGKTPHVALRVMDTLDLLKWIVPEIEPLRDRQQNPPYGGSVWEQTLLTVEKLDGVLTTISPYRTDETAAEVGYGMIVYLLDRFRHPLQDHLAQPLPNGRTVPALLVLAVLLHETGTSAASLGADSDPTAATLAEERAIALRLSNDEVTRLGAIVRHHARPRRLASRDDMPSRRDLHRFWNRTDGVGLDLCIFALADYLGEVGTQLSAPDWIRFVERIGALLDAYFNQHDTVVAPPPLVRGNTLMDALGMAPGPEVGRLLHAIEEAQAAGEIATVDEAIALARRELEHPSP
ncbi:MAG TPA: hypothetical protein VMT34_10700, partial [Aggregatilineales bacterium]|nr:hypothetical protein [Aggregatilineales bacterium]